MIQRGLVFGIFAALAAVACSAAPGETEGTSEEAIAICPMAGAIPGPCQPPVVDVYGTWTRAAGPITETLELRTDHSYALVETSTPLCIRFPCTAPTTVVARTEGTFTQSATLIKLAPVTPDPLLPEGFDIVRRLVPMAADTASDPSFMPIGPVQLHAMEGGSDIYLSKAPAQDCPSGTLRCNRCGVYPPGGVCTTFVCLPPTQRCLPVP